MLADISVTRAKAMLAENPGIVLVDVRTQGEHRRGCIEGSRNVPLGELEKLNIYDKDTPIFVYCKSGIRSEQAKDALCAKGYRDVTNIGGIYGWELIAK